MARMIFVREWMSPNMSYTCDSEAHKNLSHKESVLFCRHPRICEFRCLKPRKEYHYRWQLFRRALN